MGAYNNVKKTYYMISKGKFWCYDGEGNKLEFDAIDGFLQNIVERKKEMQGVEKTLTDFHFVDGPDNFVVSCEKFNSNSNTIIRCLSNVQDFGKKILLETWQTKKDDKTYTNIAVKQDGQRVPWCEIPEIETFKIPSGETVKSTKKREDFIDGLIKGINARLAQRTSVAAGEVGPEPEPQEDGDDMPEGSYHPNPV